MQEQGLDLKSFKIIDIRDTKQQHPYNRYHKRVQLAKVLIDYHGLRFSTQLVRGTDESDKGHYFFIEMPCVYYSQIKGNRQWKKANVVQLPGKKEVDQFQALMLMEINKQRPDLFL